MWWLGLAWAGDEEPAPAPSEPAPEPEVIEISTDATLPSAIEAVDEVHEEVALGPQLEDWIPLPGNLVRGRWVIRPLLGAEVVEGAAAVRLGAAAGHQWWTLGEGTLRAGGEETLRFTAPVGAERGRRLDLAVAAGPWVGPVGLRVGPTVAWDRAEFRPGPDALLLDEALLVGGAVDLTLVAGPVALTAGVEPAVVVAGDRGGADPAAVPLPVLGDETTWRAGVGLLGDHVELLLGAALRETAVGAVGEGTVGLRVRIL